MAVIAALVKDRREQARLREAVRSTGDIVFCSSLAELCSRVAAREANVVLCEVTAESRAGVIGAVHELRSKFPSTPILVYAGLEAEEVAASIAAVKAGATDVVLRGREGDRFTLCRALGACERQSASAEIVRALETHTPPELRGFLRYCAEHASHPLRVEGAARALGTDRKTLAARLRRAGLPPAGRIISHMRLLHALKLLEDPGRPVGEAAVSIDYPSVSALSHMARRCTGCSLSFLRAHKGFAALLEHLSRVWTRAALPPVRAPEAPVRVPPPAVVVRPGARATDRRPAVRAGRAVRAAAGRVAWASR